MERNLYKLYKFKKLKNIYACLRVIVKIELIHIKHLELCLARTCWWLLYLT